MIGHGGAPTWALSRPWWGTRCLLAFANLLKSAGVPTRDIQQAFRHRDQRTTAGSLHTSDDEKTTAINLLPGRR
jgi:hypothetical protein